MPFNGAGNFVSLSPPQYPAVPGDVIRAAYFNAVISDILNGLSNAVTRDGQSPPTSNLPMGGRKHTGAAVGVASDEYATMGQLATYFAQTVWLTEDHGGGVPASGGDATAALIAAVATGKHVIIPAGDWGISSTVTLGNVNQRLICLPGSNFWKYANVVMFQITAYGAGLDGSTLWGNLSTWGAIPGRPAAAPSFTDTTHNLIYGAVAGTGLPKGGVFSNSISQYAGLCGFYWQEGPNPYLHNSLFAKNGTWGIDINQSIVLGGSSNDTHHGAWGYVECQYNGRSAATDGGDCRFRGMAFVVGNLKAFGSYGTGLRVESADVQANVFIELAGTTNSGIPAWAAGQVKTAGSSFVINAGKLYVATTSGTTGGVAPTHTSGTASDGGVTWQYRPGLGLEILSTTYDNNQINVLHNNSGSSDAAAKGRNLVRGRMAMAPGNSAGARSFRMRDGIWSRQPNQGFSGETASYRELWLQPRGTVDTDWSLSGQADSSALCDIYFGDSTGALYTRLRGDTAGLLQDLVTGERVKNVSANYSLFSSLAAEADVYILDAAAGAFIFNLWKGGDGALIGRRIRLVKIDASANAITINGTTNTFVNGVDVSLNTTKLTAQYQVFNLVLYKIVSGTDYYWVKV